MIACYVTAVAHRSPVAYLSSRMLTVLFYVHSLRFAIPAAAMMGVAPHYLLTWGAWRILSVLLPRRMYERGDEILYDTYQSLVAFFFETYTGAEVIFYGDAIPWDKKENVIFICNHQCTVDWVVADLLAIRQGTLGNIRYILKGGLEYLPLYGFYFAQHGCIFVKRSAAEDEEHIRKKLKEIKSSGTPMWLIIFPEGTRYNVGKPEVIEKSQNFAAERGLPVLSHVLTPRTRATEVSLCTLSDYVDAVYDITIAYKQAGQAALPRLPAPPMTDFLETSGQQIHLYCRRHSMTDIPKDNEGRNKWIHQSFAEKDRILKKFYSENGGIMPGTAKRKRLSWLRTTPYFFLWAAILLPFITTKWGRSLYWKMWLMTGVGSVTYMALLHNKLQK